MAEPAAVDPAAERSALEDLVRRCRGNLSLIAREQSAIGGARITRQAITRRLAKHGLQALATELAVAAGVSGRRRQGEQAKAHRAERTRILDGLAQAASYDAAAAPLGLPIRTLYNRISRYEITPAQVAARRRTIERRSKRRA